MDFDDDLAWGLDSNFPVAPSVLMEDCAHPASAANLDQVCPMCNADWHLKCVDCGAILDGDCQVGSVR